MYLRKYRTRLLGKNIAYLKQIVIIIEAIKTVLELLWSILIADVLWSILIHFGMLSFVGLWHFMCMIDPDFAS